MFRGTFWGLRPKSIRNFLLRNLRARKFHLPKFKKKTFFWENMRNFFREKYWHWGRKVCQVALYVTTYYKLQTFYQFLPLNVVLYMCIFKWEKQQKKKKNWLSFMDHDHTSRTKGQTENLVKSSCVHECFLTIVRHSKFN